MTIGILALQGSFAEHHHTLQHLKVSTVLVRRTSDLKNVSGLIIPGGESTTMGHLLQIYGLLDFLREKIQKKQLAIWGTCAGLIVLARRILRAKKNQPQLAVLNVTVARNVFGRQIDSFEERIHFSVLGTRPFPCVFIRAPGIVAVEPSVRILGTLKDHTIIAVQQENILGTAFHPELTTDYRFHTYFLSLAKAYHRNK